MPEWRSGKESGLKLCSGCHKVCDLDTARCPRCGQKVLVRKKESLARCWALTITAALLYIPANIMPMMTVSKLDRGQPDTIMSGVIELVHMGMAPIAILVFTASILVPLLKLAGMSWLLLSIQLERQSPAKQMKLYRVIVWIGRWSMLDIFIISILVALVQFGKLGTVDAGPAAYAFAGVVVITMWAAISFDPRLLWDSMKSNKTDGSEGNTYG